MSAVYRLDLQHEPSAAWPWRCHIVRLSDGNTLNTYIGETEQEAIESAQAWVRKRQEVRESYSLELDEDGRVVSESVRV